MSNKNGWIDFSAVKQAVSMELLIIQFGLVATSRKNGEVRLKCPFHGGKSDNSMAVNLKQNSFYCFGCQAKGNVLDFVALYEDCSLHEAALLMDKWFAIGNLMSENKQPDESREEVAEAETETTSDLDSEIVEAVPAITPAHLIASIEYQLAQLKRLITPR